MLMIAIVTGVGLTTTLTIAKDKLDTLKERTAGRDIAPVKTDIVCNGDTCSAWVKQNGIVQSQIFVPRRICVDVKEVEINTGINKTIIDEKGNEIQVPYYTYEYPCISWRDYTSTELNNMINDRTSRALTEYATSLQEDKAKLVEVKA